MSGGSAANVADITKNNLFGDRADRSAMKGLSLGEVGDLYGSASKRGLGPGSYRASLGDDQLKEMQKSLGNNFGPAMEQGEADKISEWAKKQAGTIRALKDVFGPNASFSQLFDELHKLTMGGETKMSPEQLEKTVRMTTNLAQGSGLGIRGLQQLEASLGGTAAAKDVDPVFQTWAGMRGAAYAIGAQRRGAGGAGFGQADLAARAQQEGLLSVNAVGSAGGQQLGATLSLGNSIGFDKGSEAEKIFNAINAGQTTYGKGKSVYLDENEWHRIMQKSGIKAKEARAARYAKEQNQEALFNSPHGKKTLPGPCSVKWTLLLRSVKTLNQLSRIVWVAAARRWATSVKRLADDLLNMSSDIQGDPAKRSAALDCQPDQTSGRPRHPTGCTYCQRTWFKPVWGMRATAPPRWVTKGWAIYSRCTARKPQQGQLVLKDKQSKTQQTRQRWQAKGRAVRSPVSWTASWAALGGHWGAACSTFSISRPATAQQAPERRRPMPEPLPKTWALRTQMANVI